MKQKILMAAAIGAMAFAGVGCGETDKPIVLPQPINQEQAATAPEEMPPVNAEVTLPELTVPSADINAELDATLNDITILSDNEAEVTNPADDANGADADSVLLNEYLNEDYE